MWKDKIRGFCACPLIYIQNKLLLSLLFQFHKAQETQKLVLLRESSGSGHDAAGSVMEEQFDGCPGLSAADSVHCFSIWGLLEKRGHPPPLPVLPYV